MRLPFFAAATGCSLLIHQPHDVIPDFPGTFPSDPTLSPFSFLLLSFLLPTFALCLTSAPSLSQQLVTMTTRAFQVFYLEPQLSRADYRLGACREVFYGL